MNTNNSRNNPLTNICLASINCLMIPSSQTTTFKNLCLGFLNLPFKDGVSVFVGGLHIPLCQNILPIHLPLCVQCKIIHHNQKY
jgi:hypothetical protein